MSGDEDMEMGQRKAFDIGPILDSLDINAPPRSGIEYLQQVRMQLLSCPGIITTKLDLKMCPSKQTVAVNERMGQTTSSHFSSTAKWQSVQIKNFSDVRCDFFFKKKLVQEETKAREFPKISDEKAWCQFILGSYFASALQESTGCEDSPVGNYNESGSMEFKKGRKEPDGCLPVLSVMVWLSQSHIEALLSYHIKWLSEFGFSHHQGRWIYALLVCIEKPITSEVWNLLLSLFQDEMVFVEDSEESETDNDDSEEVEEA